jgi:uncharacterized RDD family membrane protein YckC
MRKLIICHQRKFPPSMDRNVDVRTPESIEFRYELAGLGSRFLALVIDQILQVLVLLAIVFGVFWGLLHLPNTGHGDEKLGSAILVAFIVVVVFLVFFGYFIAFETLWNGQTPGKKALGIRVVRDGGFPLDFGASLVRNLIRIGEFTLGYYALSAISMLLSPENKRLGDFAAGTIVVRDARLALAPNVEEPAIAYAPTRYLSGEERALVKRFLERRDAMAAENRRALARKLADRLRERLPEDLSSLDDEALLERL